ncbi:maltose ABC transporter permease MalG [Marinobacterium sedimentorum]|uniref:maltose ABC transporter permease MalG n=1 Tax=Marinobacterium sedimentorum TaxID=2927804 RepID=UPI0020C61AC1|nr:maltose ABC transporter permease MalG [Marinobacterium sedimentorum]MCP8690202.1 maltose ABC transporter permease MalG [Marinobacterium sedimentorum]
MVHSPNNLLFKKLLAHGFLWCILALILFPFLITLSISLREGNYISGGLIPDRPTLEHWYLAFGLDFVRADGTVITPPYPVLDWLWNSVKIAFIASVGVLMMATTAAYAFSRLRFRGKQTLLDGMLLVQMFPAALAVVAIYALFDSLGDITPILGIDSHWSLILVYLSGVAMHIWTIKGYFDTIDPALDKAASIDGASPFQIFRFIFLPLATPILAVVFVLSFIGIIADYPLASIMLRTEDNLTLAVGARKYLMDNKYMWGDFASAAILSGAPITILFLIAQRYLVSGLSAGGVKG